jgi:hypothetical protein
MHKPPYHMHCGVRVVTETLEVVEGRSTSSRKGYKAEEEERKHPAPMSPVENVGVLCYT